MRVKLRCRRDTYPSPTRSKAWWRLTQLTPEDLRSSLPEMTSVSTCIFSTMSHGADLSLHLPGCSLSWVQQNTGAEGSKLPVKRPHVLHVHLLYGGVLVTQPRAPLSEPWGLDVGLYNPSGSARHPPGSCSKAAEAFSLDHLLDITAMTRPYPWLDKLIQELPSKTDINCKKPDDGNLFPLLEGQDSGSSNGNTSINITDISRNITSIHIENWKNLQTLNAVDMELYTGLQRLTIRNSGLRNIQPRAFAKNPHLRYIKDLGVAEELLEKQNWTVGGGGMEEESKNWDFAFEAYVELLVEI
ncbi:hypothetical protein Q9233_010732 [Columba guinea]|nr:hypothetical protein Q9233_010732 [Columba guinea]